MADISQAIRPTGPTVALSVVATSHAAVDLNAVQSELTNFVALLNAGAVAVAVKISQNGAAATLPVDGTPGDYVLPPNTGLPVLIPCPIGPQAVAKITAIGATAGPTIIYATPCTL